MTDEKTVHSPQSFDFAQDKSAAKVNEKGKKKKENKSYGG